jgi:hypothetical protein
MWAIELLLLLLIFLNKMKKHNLVLKKDTRNYQTYI